MPWRAASGSPIDLDLIGRSDVEGRGQDLAAVDGDAAILDPAFGIATGAEAGTGNDLGKAIALRGNGGYIRHVVTPAGPGRPNDGNEQRIFRG